MSINVNEARASAHAVALSDEQLHRLAPSIFATTAHSSRSARFTPVPTIDVVNGMRQAGFQPVAAKQSGARTSDRRDFAKHLVRFRRLADAGSELVLGQVYAETVLGNANDGSSSYQLFGGLFRLACLNGLVVADGTIQSIRIGHTGKIINRVIEGSYSVVEQTNKAVEVCSKWKQIKLDAHEQQAFAKAAHELRFGPTAEGEVSPIQPHQLLGTRRHADVGNDLWTVFNRVQENAIKGDLTGYTKAGYVINNAGREVWRPSRRVSTRTVKGIDQDVKVNRGLWALASDVAAQKLAA